MNNLENAILQSQENQILREKAKSEYVFTDELGITITKPIKELSDTSLGLYIAYRVIKRNKNLFVNPEEDLIFRGHHPIPVVESREMLLRLAAASYTRHGSTAYAWEFLHELLPKLDRTKLVIMPGLLFDRQTGEIIRTDGKELTV